MKNNNQKRARAESEKFQYQPELQKNHEAVNYGQKLEELGKSLDVNKQTPEKTKEQVFNLLKNAKKKCPTADELKALGYKPIEFSKFQNFDQMMDSAQITEQGTNTLAFNYMRNFLAEGLDFEIGEYKNDKGEEGYAIWTHRG